MKLQLAESIAVVGVLLAAAHASAFAPFDGDDMFVQFATIAGTPEVVGGPVGNMFDNPTSGTAHGGTRQYTANSATYIYDDGPIANVSNIIHPPSATGLGPNPSPLSYSHCGKWLNSVWGDAQNTSIVHAFYHQEWNCDYSRDSFTNKSIGYAVSVDGGKTFTPFPDSNNQIIAGANFTTEHQTGEGDHGVVQVGDYLYLFFTEWDGWRGAVTVGVARSAVESTYHGTGVPGTWWKYSNGSFSSPGVGGASDLFHLPGTAVSVIKELNVVVSVGLCWSGSACVRAYDLSPTNAASSFPSDLLWYDVGPIFAAGPGSWDRTSEATELYAYLSIIGTNGNDRPLPADASFVYFTYLLPGQGFGDRYLVRRPLRFMAQPTNSTSPSPSLAELSIWSAPGTGIVWSTAGPVIGGALYPWSPTTAFILEAAAVALLPTSPPNTTSWVELVDCIETVTTEVNSSSIFLAKASECIAVNATHQRSVMRPVGWVALSASVASSVSWVASGMRDPATGQLVTLRTTPLFAGGNSLRTSNVDNDHPHDSTLQFLGYALSY